MRVTYVCERSRIYTDATTGEHVLRCKGVRYKFTESVLSRRARRARRISTSIVFARARSRAWCALPASSKGMVLAGDCELTTARYERVTPEDVRGTIELLERADAALAPARHDRSAKMLKNVK
jgi:hypothetical protein